MGRFSFNDFSIIRCVFVGAILLVIQVDCFGQTDSVASDSPTQPVLEQSEADAIAFVREHHPELVSLLQSLKSMRQKEYEMAIREIVRTKKRLETLAKREADLM